MTKLMYEKVVKCGDYVEVYRYDRPVAYGFDVKRDSVARVGTVKRTDNVERARKSLVRRIMTNGTQFRPLFVTLTYKDTQLDRDQTLKDLAKFVRKLRQLYPRAGYVYVLERQKARGQREGNDGSWHVHALIFNVGFIPVKLLLSWWPKGGEKNGVDVKKNRSFKDTKHVALYLAKYLGKDMAVAGKRVFSTSRNLVREQTFRSLTDYVPDYDLVYANGYFNAVGNFIKIEIYYGKRSYDGRFTRQGIDGTVKGV